MSLIETLLTILIVIEIVDFLNERLVVNRNYKTYMKELESLEQHVKVLKTEKHMLWGMVKKGLNKYDLNFDIEKGRYQFVEKSEGEG